LKRRIESDLYDGDFHKAVFLPPAKQLQTRYAVDFRTLKKALKSLVEDRVLQAHKRSYRVARPEESHPENLVVYLTPQDLYRTPFRSFPEAGDLVRVLESECGRRRLLFRPQSLGDSEAFHRLIRDYRVLGGLFYQSGTYSRELLEECAAMRKPIAMFDNYNHAQRMIPKSLMCRCRLRVFQFDEVFAGGEVGRFLLRQGHRHVAFISPFHGDWVYPIRYESLRSAIEGSGRENTVALVGVNNLRLSLQERASRILESRRQRIADGAREEDISAELSGLGLAQGSDEVLLTWARESGSWNVNPDHVFSAVLHEALLPLFERALQLPQVTAWVCANDGIAIHALRHLRHRRVPVPEHLSVIGFDNTGDASYNHLTSYDFDVASIALKMLDHVLRPDSSLYPASTRVVDSPGMVISRASSGPPRS
jgi:DNA-binding LacI/PurR family transcriptional regulator